MLSGAGESYEESAAREIEEEMGISGVTLKRCFEFLYRDDMAQHFGGVFCCTYDGPLKLDPQEVESAEWWDLQVVPLHSVELHRNGSWTGRNFFTRPTDPRRPFGHKPQSSLYMRTGVCNYLLIYLLCRTRVASPVCRMHMCKLSVKRFDC